MLAANFEISPIPIKVYCKNCKNYIKGYKFCQIFNPYTEENEQFNRNIINGEGDCSYYEQSKSNEEK